MRYTIAVAKRYTSAGSAAKSLAHREATAKRWVSCKRARALEGRHLFADHTMTYVISEKR